MRGSIELLLTDGRLTRLGPFDATDAGEFLRRAREHARRMCRTGHVKALHICLGLDVVACYRSRGNNYQLARGYRRIGALAVPNWRG